MEDLPFAQSKPLHLLWLVELNLVLKIFNLCRSSGVLYVDRLPAIL
jgi:hypothetical protein